MEGELVFFFLIMLTALFYSSVGHGGASGYLAIMGLYGIAPEYMKATALTLNLFVAGIAFWVYYRGKYFHIKLLWPFILLSIPMSFLGARFEVPVYTYKLVLGLLLLLALSRMLFFKGSDRKKVEINIPLAIVIGGVIGFLSGMIGIGGGIILSPILLLLGWASIKETAAISAIFIFLNSASGISGMVSKGFHVSDQVLVLIVLGIVGSVIGSFIGQKKLNSKILTYVLALVLFSASMKMIFF